MSNLGKAHMQELPEAVVINWDSVHWPGGTSEHAQALVEELAQTLKSARVFSMHRAAEGEEIKNPTQNEYPEYRYTGRKAITIIYAKEADNAV